MSLCCMVTESVAEYLEEEGGVDCNQKLGQKSQGYKCVLNSKSSEDSLVIDRHPFSHMFLFVFLSLYILTLNMCRQRLI